MKSVAFTSDSDIPDGWAALFRMPSLTSSILRTSLDMMFDCRRKSINLPSGISEKSSAFRTSLIFTLAVAGAECNTVIELKPEHHAALPWHFA